MCACVFFSGRACTTWWSCQKSIVRIHFYSTYTLVGFFLPLLLCNNAIRGPLLSQRVEDTSPGGPGYSDFVEYKSSTAAKIKIKESAWWNYELPQLFRSLPWSVLLRAAKYLPQRQALGLSNRELDIHMTLAQGAAAGLMMLYAGWNSETLSLCWGGKAVLWNLIDSRRHRNSATWQYFFTIPICTFKVKRNATPLYHYWKVEPICIDMIGKMHSLRVHAFCGLHSTRRTKKESSVKLPCSTGTVVESITTLRMVVIWLLEINSSS